MGGKQKCGWRVKLYSSEGYMKFRDRVKDRKFATSTFKNSLTTPTLPQPRLVISRVQPHNNIWKIMTSFQWMMIQIGLLIYYSSEVQSWNIKLWFMINRETVASICCANMLRYLWKNITSCKNQKHFQNLRKIRAVIICLNLTLIQLWKSYQ